MPRSIPVGMYHHVNHNAGDFITVSVENFRRQMKWLRQENYQTLDAETFLRALRGELHPSSRCFVITFDDAWLDVHAHAFPILKEFGHKFIVFAVSDWTEQASRQKNSVEISGAFPTHRAAEKLVKENRAGEVICSWQHLREMQDGGLASIENHSASHCNAIKITAADLCDNLLRCKNAIRENLGRDSRHLCWPYGQHNSATLQLARELDFSTTYLVRRGANLVGGNSFAAKRFTVEDRDETWLKKQIGMFSNPIVGFLYARLKPDRRFRRFKNAA
jgi:peptidoglycan/xylan/chitin deacetylase (PgdA/CDA1 family)